MRAPPLVVQEMMVSFVSRQVAASSSLSQLLQREPLVPPIGPNWILSTGFKLATIGFREQI